MQPAPEYREIPRGDPAILGGQGGEASMEISTRDIIKMRD